MYVRINAQIWVQRYKKKLTYTRVYAIFRIKNLFQAVMSFFMQIWGMSASKKKSPKVVKPHFS